MNYMFVYRNIVVGGCEFLIEKLGREVLKNEKNNIIIYFETIDEIMYSRFSKNGFCLKQVKEDFYKFEFQNINIITFTLKDYIFFSCNELNNVKTVLYVVHPYIFNIATKRNFILKLFSRRLLKTFILKAIKNKCIFFMDKETVQSNLKYFSIRNVVDDAMIVNLPIDLVENNEEVLNKRAKTKNYIKILSIARAEFPFKGYLIGLVDFLSKNDKENIMLTIISYGKGFNILKQKIESLPINIKQKIKLYGKTDYDKLNEYFNDSNLYIGMGTTVLDAAIRGVITIPIKAYTYELIADKFFHEMFSDESHNKIKNRTFQDLFNEFIRIKNSDYLTLSYKNIKIVNENFSTVVITKKILENFKNVPFTDKNIKISILLAFYKIKNKLDSVKKQF